MHKSVLVNTLSDPGQTPSSCFVIRCSLFGPNHAIRYQLVRRSVPQWIRPPSTSSLRLLYKSCLPLPLVVCSRILSFYSLASFGPLRRSIFNMGILGRKAPPPTTINLGDASHPSTQSSGDPEKTNKEVQLENNTIGARARNIDPELERRVVRKLDWHVPPLVAFLCESQPCSRCKEY
jgi:hypothetical protein